MTPPCLPNNWCNNTINISAHIHTAIDLLPKCGRGRKRSRARAACGAWLAPSPSCGFLRDGREVHSSCEMKKISMNHEGKSSVGFWIVPAGKYQFPSSCCGYCLILLLEQSPRGLWILLKYWRSCLFWSGKKRVAPDNALHQTVTRD